MRIQLDSAQIGGAGGVGGTGDVGQAVPAGGSGSGANGVGAGASDSIQISGAAGALNRLAADRTAQIQQLTAAVQGGSYQVPSALVGGAIVNHAIA